MIVETRIGSPHHKDVKRYTSAALAKKWLRKEIAANREWAAKFNRQADAELGAVSSEVNDLNIQSLPVGDVRSWKVEDEVTGVWFCFDLEIIQR